jgi:hypothetical protein
MVNKIIHFTSDGIGFPLAYKALQEGAEVVVAEVQDLKDINPKNNESPEDRKLRLKNYANVFQKYDANKVLKVMETIDDKDDWFIFCDFNNLWPYAEKALKMGFKNGLFPTKEDASFEEERQKAKDFVQKNYKGISIAEVYECQTIEEGKEIMAENPDTIFVLKGNSEDAKTFVPSSNIPALVNKQIEDTLDNNKEVYEKDGFVLEEKIQNPYELTPELIFYNGVPVCASVDIENKPIGSGNIGDQTGCASCLVFKTKFTDKINQVAFPKLIYDMAKKHTGMFVCDAGLLAKDNKLYFTEFCFNRLGWDSVMNEVAMSGGVREFFGNIQEGKNPFKYYFGASVRGFNLPEKDKGNKFKLEKSEMRWLDRVDKQIFLYEMQLEGGKVENMAHSTDLVVATGASDNLEKAIDRAYEAMEGFSFQDLYYRPKFDFFADYPTSVMNRYKFGIKKNLFSTNKLIRIR